MEQRSDDDAGGAKQYDCLVESSMRVEILQKIGQEAAWEAETACKGGGDQRGSIHAQASKANGLEGQITS